MENNIRKLRKQKGITQRQLADAVGTSQQQVQRFETGTSPIKFDIAVKICDVLGKPLQTIFPQTKSILGGNKKTKSKSLTEDEISNRLSEVGIETDLLDWTISIFLPSGIKRSYPISSRDRERFDRTIDLRGDHSEARTFFCFDSEDYEVAINLRQASMCQVSFYSHRFATDPKESEDQSDDPMERAPAVNVWLAGQANPLLFDVEFDDVGSSEEDPITGQFRSVMFELDSLPNPESFISFADIDGDYIHIQVNQLALLEIPMWVTTPSLIDDDEEVEDDSLRVSDSSVVKTDSTEK